MLKTEKARIGTTIDAAKDRLADLDADLTEQQEILELAAALATCCGDAYCKANDRTHKLLNAAVFECLDVKGGRLCHEQHRPPFDGVFTVPELEYGTRVEVAGIEPASLGSAACILRAQSADRSQEHRRRRRHRSSPAGLGVPSSWPARWLGKPHMMTPMPGPWGQDR